MTFDQLRDFVSNRMRMAHIYQPVMLMTLLRSGGAASITKIAKAILSKDESQIEYYEKITRDMVGRVLRNHKVVSKDGKTFRLDGFETLSPDQVAHLISLCERKLDDYLEERGKRVFQHRRQSTRYISGTLRYDVLKRSAFHCELCGISADVRALEVDHIVPRSHGGSDDHCNLQALCYSCNAMKRDRDDTNLRAVRESFSLREKGCLFCHMPMNRVIAENELAYAVFDGFPVTKHHALVIPKRHILDYFTLSRPELNACDALVREIKEEIEELDNSVTAFNLGTNAGKDAGQSVFHCHIHVIPRRPRDVAVPKGGVRNVIPGKGMY